MILNIADRHPTGIERNDHVIEPAKTPRPCGHQAQDEASATVPGNIQIYFAELSRDDLVREAIA